LQGLPGLQCSQAPDTATVTSFALTRVSLFGHDLAGAAIHAVLAIINASEIPDADSLGPAL